MGRSYKPIRGQYYLCQPITGEETPLEPQLLLLPTPEDKGILLTLSYRQCSQSPFPIYIHRSIPGSFFGFVWHLMLEVHNRSDAPGEVALAAQLFEASSREEALFSRYSNHRTRHWLTSSQPSRHRVGRLPNEMSTSGAFEKIRNKHHHWNGTFEPFLYVWDWANISHVNKLFRIIKDLETNWNWLL